jgi:thioredoxin reductase (NADPH)
MSSPQVTKVVIVGSGPAGLTAAIYAARADLAPIVYAGMPPGGQLTITTEVENYPGFPDGVNGPELMISMRKQAERFGAKVIDDTVKKVDLSVRPFKLLGSSGTEVHASTVIVATGASAMWMDVPGEETYMGKGVSACATCDGFFFRGKEIVVVGGGDSALEEATFLTKFATKVTVIHRRDSLRASKAMQKRAFANEKIKFMWDSVVEEVLGDGKQVSGVRVKNVKDGKTSVFPCSGVFVAIGHHPNTDVFHGQLEMDEKCYLRLHENTRTSVDGVFGAGDVADHRYRQAISAAGTGCMAALDAQKWLEEHHQ